MTPQPLKGYFVSDLHMFARRSTAPERMQEIHEAARHAHTLVLGGDIFDFKWSTHASMEHAIDAAESVLRDLFAANDRCRFHFILGNHDANPIFVERLASIGAELPQFSWHRYFLRLDHCLFLHGDIADGDPHHNWLDAHRTKFDRDIIRGQAWHLLYDVAVQAQIHRLVVAAANRQNTLLDRLATYADLVGHGETDGVHDIYFGHTHRELDGVAYNGLRFHNGGAAIRGLGFRIVETTLAARPATA